jgi:MFS family permease
MASGMAATEGGHRQSERALDALNFIMADVQTGVGPYLAIFLRAVRHFGPGQIGLVMASGVVAQIAAQTPLGALIDRTTKKRVLVAAAAGLLAVAAIALAVLTPVWTVVAAQSVIGVTGAVFPPAVAALSLGIVGKAALPRRMARNEGFNHAGNVAAAIAFGAVGVAIGTRAIFWCVVGLGVAAAVAALAIRERDIDHARARGGGSGSPEGLRVLFRDRSMLAFVASVVLFHAANAAMLPLVGEQLAGGDDRAGPLYMSAIIIVAQLTMLGVDVLLARRSDRLRHKPLFLIGFDSIALRGVLFAVSRSHALLIAIQVLDGIGAGIFGVVSVLVIAELTHGTGRFNLAQGATATAIGIGAALSNVGAGELAKREGFPAAFLALAAVAMTGCAFYAWLVPETAAGIPQDTTGPGRESGARLVSPQSGL